ncbi:MAG TPA: FtsX-like permease family protein, partial [Thermomicrobiales bacterium]|nr:FtsX-like permease family protein [Thermomicrobiales bacterium]
PIRPEGSVSQEDVAGLRQIAGVTTVTIAYSDTTNGWDISIPLAEARALGLSDAPGDQWFTTTMAALTATGPRFVPPPGVISANPVGKIPATLLIGTDGSRTAIERARTEATHFPWITGSAVTRGDLADQQTRTIASSFASLSYIGILITTLIASVALTVATAAAMLERKRIFGLLRLMGMPTSTLQRIVAFEAVVPLVAVVLFSAALGWVVAWLMVEGLSYSRSVHLPDGRYLGTIAFSLALAASSVLVTSRLLQQNTTVTQTRFE